jgi:hypothetical protein
VRLRQPRHCERSEAIQTSGAHWIAASLPLLARLNPGFVTDCRLDGNARIVTFHNGNVIAEELVDCDDARRRLAYAILGREGITHYNGSVQVLGDGNSGSRIVWTIDVLPGDIAPYISSQMDLAAAAMQKTLGRA